MKPRRHWRLTREHAFVHADALIVASLFGMLAVVILPSAFRRDVMWLKILGCIFVLIAVLGLVRDLYVKIERRLWRKRYHQKNQDENHRDA